MVYFISFLEGIVTFISPCILPMLPIYLSYFAGQNIENDKRVIVTNSIGFVIGFTSIFVFLGLFAGTIGNMLKDHSTAVNLISGIIIIIFGLSFLDILHLPIINNKKQIQLKTINFSFVSAFIFGVVFAISWTPCIGVFLGSALMLAASNANSFDGMLMLFCFSLGLGLPFIASAVLINQLKSSFTFIKKNYRIINFISGVFLIIIGLLISTGLMGYFLSSLTF